MNRMIGQITLSVIVSLCLISLNGRDCAAFRCGNGLVGIGDTKARVLVECGKPFLQEKTGSKKTGSIKERKGGGSSAHKIKYREVSKKVEKWYYNCGENDFIYILTFEDSILRQEDTGGRGKGKSGCQGR